MRKKIIALFMAATFALSGCGNNSTSDGVENNQEDVKKPLDLTGAWASKDNNGSWMEAEISDEVITINWVSDGGDTKSIYWVGSYVAPEKYTEEYNWSSNRDKEKTDSALMASTDDTKEFSYDNGEILYEASALGSTTTMHLKKNK